MEFMMKENCFGFISYKLYHQKSETTNDTKAAPSYANTFTSGLENQIFEHTGYNTFSCLRYLDDIFYILKGRLEILTKFLKYFNNFHKTIKFAMSYSYQKSKCRCSSIEGCQ